MAAEYLAAMGAKIRERREELGMTQDEVAREMPGKVTGNRVSLWERGRHRPHDDSLEALARVLRVPVSYFMASAPDKGATPSPFGDGSAPALTRLEEALAAARREIAEARREGADTAVGFQALIDQQSDLLRRQSAILERIEGLVGTLPSDDPYANSLVESLRDDAPRDDRSPSAAEGSGRARRSRRPAAG
jgi:transcriptional regulator with XRE-family HTH domain